MGLHTYTPTLSVQNMPTFSIGGYLGPVAMHFPRIISKLHMPTKSPRGAKDA